MNDLVVVAEDQFYYTNWLSTKLPFHLQRLAGISWGSVGFYDGRKTAIMDTDLFMPNGINISPDKRYTNNQVYIMLVSP